MSKSLNLSDSLDFSEIDLTAPDKVVKEILNQIPEETNNIIYGKIDEYNGEVTSYKTTISLRGFLGGQNTEYIDIQNSLGKMGEKESKFECYLYTSIYEEYKYRMFFMKYGIAHYPVQFTLEESIARSIQREPNYIVTCNNRAEVEELILKILTSKKVLSVMQELIQIYQSKKIEKVKEVTYTPADAETKQLINS